AKMMVQFSQPSGPTAGTTRDLGQALRECPTAAVAIETMKSACRDVDRDGPTLPGEIPQRASIRAVDASRWGAADRAGCRGRPWRCFDCDAIRCREDTRHFESVRNEGQQGRAHRTEHHGRESRCLPDSPTKYRPDSTESAGEPVSLRHQHRVAKSA